MFNIIEATEGMVYRNKINGMICKTIIFGVNDSIDNYELIPEPEEEQEVEDNGESDVSV